MRLKPSHKNHYPLKGILLKGSHPEAWIAEIQRMGLSLHQVIAYPIPGNTANSIWGCLLVSQQQIDKDIMGKNRACQLIAGLLFIPENALLYPKVNKEELEHFLLSKPHLMHPEIGMVLLEKPIKWEDLLEVPEQEATAVSTVASSIFIPSQIKSFQVQALSEEEMIQKMETDTFPQSEELNTKPLTFFEKGRLKAYEFLFNSKENKDGTTDIGKTTFFEKILHRFPNMNFSQIESWYQDFEALQERNKKEVDRLINLLKNNPEEALKYAIPLDEKGVGRGGGTPGAFTFSHRWNNYGLFGNTGNSSGSGSAVFEESEYNKLLRQYRETALALIKQEKYKKAAFIYLKLLKDYSSAANTLEQGQFYQEAASVYLKHLSNKHKAAECYEKGKMYTEAINLYEELLLPEKAGDLYVLLNEREKALSAFHAQVKIHQEKYRYYEAALLCQSKIADLPLAQTILLQGWEERKKGPKCLKTYFENISDLNELGRSIQHVYSEKVVDRNTKDFLHIIRGEYQRGNELATDIRELAYEIVAKQIQQDPSFAIELKYFNPEDKEVAKDALRWRRG